VHLTARVFWKLDPTINNSSVNTQNTGSALNTFIVSLKELVNYLTGKKRS
jgi:hypothetical protein